MDFPGLNLEKLTDSEIYARIGELNSKLMASYHMGNQSLVNQLQAMIETMQYEQQSRQFKKIAATITSSVVIDTDINEINKPVKIDSKKENKPVNNIFAPKRSKTPSSGE